MVDHNIYIYCTEMLSKVWTLIIWANTTLKINHWCHEVKLLTFIIRNQLGIYTFLFKFFSQLSTANWWPTPWVPLRLHSCFIGAHILVWPPWPIRRPLTLAWSCTRPTRICETTWAGVKLIVRVCLITIQEDKQVSSKVQLSRRMALKTWNWCKIN